MNDQKTLDIIGDWEVSIFTPFGTSISKVNIVSAAPFVSGTIVGEKGSLEFDNGTIAGNMVTIITTADTPIKATLTMRVEVIDDKFKGTLEVDQYMKVDIRGQKNVNL
jgi:hypothetical protein